MDKVIRSIVIPASRPLSHQWEELNPVLNACFRASTHAANWCILELVKRDTTGEAKTPNAVKMGRTDKGMFYAYGEALKTPLASSWIGGKQSLNIVLQYAHREYLRRRFDVMVRHEQSLLTVRYPYPYPLDADAWSLSYTTEEGEPSGSTFPVFHCRLPGLEKPLQLRLKRSNDFRRQLDAFKQLYKAQERRRELLSHINKGERLTPQEQAELDELPAKGEAALYRNNKGELLVKMVGKFPPPPKKEHSNVCFLHTDPNAMLVAEVNGRSVTITNGDHIQRWIVANAKQEKNYAQKTEQGQTPPIPPHRGGGPVPITQLENLQASHKTLLERARQDKKREVRMRRRQRQGLNQSVEAICDKHNHKIQTAVKQIAAQVARFCQRQRVGLIAYDDSVQTFLPSGFPWHALKTRLRQIFAGEMGGEWIDGQFPQLNSDEEKQEWLKRTRAVLSTVPKVKAHKSRPPGKSHPKVSTVPATSSSSGAVSSTTCSPGTGKRKSSRGQSAAPGT